MGTVKRYSPEVRDRVHLGSTHYIPARPGISLTLSPQPGVPDFATRIAFRQMTYASPNMKIAFFGVTPIVYGGGAEISTVVTAVEMSVRYPHLSIDIVTNDDRFAKRLNFFLRIFYLKKPRYVLDANSENGLTRLGATKIRYIQARSILQLRRHLRSYDLIYSKNEIVEAVVLKSMSFRSLPPVVFVCHTAIEYPSPKKWQERLHNWIYLGGIYKFLCKKVTAFRALNSCDAEHLSTKFQIVSLIPNPESPQELLGYDLINDSVEISASSFNVAWIGRIVDQKGVDELLEILRQYDANRPHLPKITWNIFGDGSRRAEIVRIANSNPSVKYHGYVSRGTLVAALRQMDLFISTSRWETFGLTILEAIGCRIPVIAFNIPGPIDIITNGENGFLVNSLDDFFDRIVYFAEGGKVSSPGSGLAKFDPDQVYEKLLNLFQLAIRTRHENMKYSSVKRRREV